MKLGEDVSEAGDMILFAQLFPGIARDETRRITNLNRQDIPKGKFALLESYCASPKCDCRRVFLNVVHDGKFLATIGYGWEKPEFYRKWLGAKTDEGAMVSEVKGPILEMGGYSSDYSDALLGLFRECLMTDKEYVARLRRHYGMFKAKMRLKGRAQKRAEKDGRSVEPKIGRNEACQCGSGKKFKKCCMKI